MLKGIIYLGNCVNQNIKIIDKEVKVILVKKMKFIHKLVIIQYFVIIIMNIIYC